MVKIRNISKHQPEGMVLEVDDMKAKELIGTGIYIYESEVKKVKKQSNGTKSNISTE